MKHREEGADGAGGIWSLPNGRGEACNNLNEKNALIASGLRSNERHLSGSTELLQGPS